MSNVSPDPGVHGALGLVLAALALSAGAQTTARPIAPMVMKPLAETPRAQVSMVNASVALASSANPAPASATVTLTATVRGTEPTGSVTFKDGDTTLGTAPCVNAVATWVARGLSSGEHAVTAVYGGDAKHLAGTSDVLTQTVN